MPRPEYHWRRLSPAERETLLGARRAQGNPWHSPPHRPNFGHSQFHVTAACYEHRPHIGNTIARMDAFARDLVASLATETEHTYAWCVLPNHYHALVQAPDILRLLRRLGQLHGRTSHAWNGEEGTRGRKVFFRAVERGMRSDAHFLATLNYVHHNPVHHGYVARWSDWPWSSTAEYIEQVGKQEAARVWRAYPVLDYGRGWDDPAL